MTERRRDFVKYTDLMEQCRIAACQLARQCSELQRRQCSIELESGGNIKFTAGDSSLPWYKSCTDIVHSRFSVDSIKNVVSTESTLKSALFMYDLSWQGITITGIKVKAVTRVENRMLYNRLACMSCLLHC